MLIEDKELGVKEFDKLIEEMTKYVSFIRENRKNEKRIWNPSNKYHTNRGEHSSSISSNIINVIRKNEILNNSYN